VVGRRNIEGQHFDQVSSHARINVLTVSDLSSAKIRPLGSCTTIIRLSRYSMAKE